MLFVYRVVVRVPRLPLLALLVVPLLLSLLLVPRVVAREVVVAVLRVEVLRLLLAAARVGEALLLEEEVRVLPVVLPPSRLVAVLRVGVVEVLVRVVAVLLVVLRVVVPEVLLRLLEVEEEVVAGVLLPPPRLVALLVLLLVPVLWLLRVGVPVVGLLSRVEAAAGVGTVGRFTPGVQAPAGMGAGWWGVRM